MDNSSNGPYVPRPDLDGESSRAYREYNNNANSMAKAASTLGVMALISVVTMLIYPALVLGSISIILALLSRDRTGYMHDKAKTAVTTGALAIGINLAILGLTAGVLLSDGPVKQQINEVFEEVYGYTFDDMWEDARDGRLDLNYGNLPIGNTDTLSPTDI